MYKNQSYKEKVRTLPISQSLFFILLLKSFASNSVNLSYPHYPQTQPSIHHRHIRSYILSGLFPKIPRPGKDRKIKRKTKKRGKLARHSLLEGRGSTNSCAFFVFLQLKRLLAGIKNRHVYICISYTCERACLGIFASGGGRRKAS